MHSGAGAEGGFPSLQPDLDLALPELVSIGFATSSAMTFR